MAVVAASDSASQLSPEEKDGIEMLLVVQTGVDEEVGSTTEERGRNAGIVRGN